MFGFPFLTSLVVTMALVVAFSLVINFARDKNSTQEKSEQQGLQTSGDSEAERPTLRNRLA